MFVRNAAVGALRRLELIFYEETDSGALVVPVPVGDSGYLLIHLLADEEVNDVLLDALVYRVPKGRRTAVALALAQLNAERKSVVWSMQDDVVRADISVDLAHVADAEACIARGVVRLFSAIAEERDRVAAAGRRGRARAGTRVDREIEEILRRVDA